MAQSQKTWMEDVFFSLWQNFPGQKNCNTSEDFNQRVCQYRCFKTTYRILCGAFIPGINAGVSQKTNMN